MSKQTEISLVLGSGGARGLAHIGVIEVLEEQGYKIRSIAGASMGAVIGGIYAAGKLDDYKEWVCSLSKADVIRYFDLSFDISGLFKGERIIEKLKSLVGEVRIEDLPVSFTAVATDIEEQKEVWLSRGSLFQAIHASMAIPIVFTPVKVDGRYLLDGALSNPIPIAPTLRDHTDLTIAVDVNGPPGVRIPSRHDRDNGQASDTVLKSDNPVSRLKSFIRNIQGSEGADPQDSWNVFEIISQSLDMLQSNITRFKLAAYNPDITITVSRDAAGSFEFYRATELIELGRHRAEGKLAEVK